LRLLFEVCVEVAQTHIVVLADVFEALIYNMTFLKVSFLIVVLCPSGMILHRRWGLITIIFSYIKALVI